MSTPITAVSLLEKYYSDYGHRARELKKDGRHFLGYFCAYVPLEIISAAGFIPFRIKGNNHEPATAADEWMETAVCPVVRNYFNQTLNGRWDFIEGIVLPHSCDSMCITRDIWRSSLELPYFYVLNLPHTNTPRSLQFFVHSLHTFRVSLERYTGKPIPDKTISEEITKYNHLRKALRLLYQLGRKERPSLAGVTRTKLVMAVMSLPVEEAVLLTNKVLGEIQSCEVFQAKTGIRTMIVSSEQQEDTVAQLIEDCGGIVVTDFSCPGTREIETDVEIGNKPIEALAQRYLNLHCARTHRHSSGNYFEELNERFSSIGSLLQDFRVEAVVLRVHRCCDPYGLEVPAIRSYLAERGVPTLYIEDDYSVQDLMRLRTKLQAFFEVVRNGITRDTDEA